jgi:hypothetical protein
MLLQNPVRAMLLAAVCQFARASTPSARIRVQGPGVAPQLMFACCDHGVSQMPSLFAIDAAESRFQKRGVNFVVVVPA